MEEVFGRRASVKEKNSETRHIEDTKKLLLVSDFSQGMIGLEK